MRRHDLVYLHAGAAIETVRSAPMESPILALATWLESGRPLVAARQGEHPGKLALGLRLPNNPIRRLALMVAPDAVASVRPPLLPENCMSRLPPSFHAPLRELASEIRGVGARVGVYGSVAWEVLSDHGYRHPDSDIDLIVDVENRYQLETAIDVLGRIAGLLPCRLDGEVRIPNGDAVNWRELAAAYASRSGNLLVKGERAVSLKPLANLLDSFSVASSLR
ncbi:MAG TPA: malonate decarboxylase holo-[acyl-carrier-protein] synthase [Noviherbaspirillum sp.]|nr:malonate decarboxylase holo-[acyl-carrier-protein] synthase [Noviherbaspirillum sp.]